MSILKVKNITKSFDSEEIIRDISLELHEGEIVSLLGVSGGGKTTLFNIIAGLSVPDEGEVFLEEEYITGKPGQISYMLQKDLLLPYRTIVDNVALPLIIRVDEALDEMKKMLENNKKIEELVKGQQ